MKLYLKLILAIGIFFIIGNCAGAILQSAANTDDRPVLVNITPYLQNHPTDRKVYMNFKDSFITYVEIVPDSHYISLVINDKRYVFTLNDETLTFLKKYINLEDKINKNQQ